MRRKAQTNTGYHLRQSGNMHVGLAPPQDTHSAMMNQDLVIMRGMMKTRVAVGRILSGKRSPIYEWVQDRYHYNYDGAPTDGSVWESGDDSNRVIRGGSWYFYAGYCHSAYRSYGVPGARNSFLGFRLLEET